MSLAHVPQSSARPVTSHSNASNAANAAASRPPTAPGTKPALLGKVEGPSPAGAAAGTAAAAAGPTADAVEVLAGQSLVQCIAQLCVEVHKSVEAAADRMHDEIKRR